MQLRDSGKGYSQMRPKGFTICCFLVAVAQAGEGSPVLNFLCAKDQANESCEQYVSYLADFPSGYKGYSSAQFSHCFFLPSFSSSLHLWYYLQSIGQVIIFHHLSISESCTWNHFPKIGAQTHVAGTLRYA